MSAIGLQDEGLDFIDALLLLFADGPRLGDDVGRFDRRFGARGQVHEMGEDREGWTLVCLLALIGL